MTFLGEDFINYRVLETGGGGEGGELKRMRRQAGASGYSTARNRISLSLTTDNLSGTVLQLGDPQGSSEYITLRVMLLSHTPHG